MAVIDTNLPRLDWRVVLNRTSPKGQRGWGRVRAAQLTEMGRTLHLAMLGQIINALLLAWVLWDSIEPYKILLWLGALLGLMVLTLRISSAWRGRELISVPRRAIDRAAYYGVLFGALWSIPPSYVFQLVGHADQLAICLVTVSMMAGAVFTFATVPPAAGGYILIVGAAANNMLTSGTAPGLPGIAPIYTAGLLLMVINNGRAFMQRKCVELALEERTETISLLLREYENSDADWLWQTNAQLCFQNVSSRFARALGRNADELEGMSILALTRDAVADPAAARSMEPIVGSVERRAPFTEIAVPIRGGERWVELSARPRFNNLGRFIGYRGVGSDVTEARQTADRIRHMARHDALTGLPNRLQLTEELAVALEASQAGGEECAVLLVDLDRFKVVNDSLGHVAGDHLLQQVSARFAPLLPAGTTAGRLGGDEFALVIPHPGGRSGVLRLGLEIIEALKKPFLYNDQHLFVGASIGAAFGPTDGDSVEELIRNADLALYRAKDEGGNEVSFYEPGLHARVEERRRIELELRSAMDEGELHLVYQPMVDQRGTLCSFETLLRWTHPDMGVIPPSVFIPIAEETGLLNRIGEWVLRHACAEATTWPGHVSLSVNISPRQLQDPTFALALVSALSQSGLDPQRLELEVTETVFLNLTPMTQRALQQIRSLGVRLAMDDFGTGYSSLGYLREAHFDTLKIDKKFVEGMSRADPESAAIVKAVVALARSLDMRTVAEGVETDEQLAMVRELDCDLAQGFVISDPVPAAEARVLLGLRRGLAAA